VYKHVELLEYVVYFFLLRDYIYIYSLISISAGWAPHVTGSSLYYCKYL